MRYTFHAVPNIERIVTGQIFPGTSTRIDRELALYEQLFPRVQRKEKVTTVRYGRDKIRVPAGPELPLVLTKPDDQAYREPHGTIKIPRFSVLRFGELTDQDAVRDGLPTREHLIAAIKGIYEPMYNAPVRDEDWVSIYELILP